MICPKCHQPVQPQPGEACPLCRFDVQPFMRRVQTIYVISFAFFLSTVIYGALVFFLETRRAIEPQTIPVELPFALLVVAVLQFGVAANVGKRLGQAATMQRVQTIFLIRLALVEAVAIYGLVLYMLTASIHWFVTFLALSWLGFILSGGQMPHIVQRLAELSVEEQAE
jgi:F0F1-type ATP synthase membrane subunit c/vacuolar-type H+-ATPase subunit K